MRQDLFTKINSKCQDFGVEFNQQKIRVDFESAPIGVIEELYPTVGMQLSLQSMSVEDAQTDSAVREHVRSVAALAHLPPADILEGW